MEKIFCLTVLLISLGISNLHAGDNILSSNNVSRKKGWRTWIYNKNYTSKVIENWNNNQYSVKIPEYKRKVEHSVQLYIKNDKLEFGEKYRVSFELNTDKPGQISINYILGRHPYTCYAKAKLEIKPNKKKYECIIAPLKVKGEYYLPRTLRFFLGNIQKNTISIKNIKLVTINQPPKK